MKKIEIIERINFIIEDDSELEKDGIIEMFQSLSKNQLRKLVDSSIFEPLMFYWHNGWNCYVMYNPKLHALTEITNG